MIALPLSLAGFHSRSTRPTSGTARVIVVGNGGPAGITVFDGALAWLLPTSLVAVTVKVYGVPLVRPANVGRRRVAADTHRLRPGCW